MEQFWRQIRIQRAKIHKTSLVRSPAQGTFFLWACVIIIGSNNLSLIFWSCRVISRQIKMSRAREKYMAVLSINNAQKDTTS